MTFAAQFRQSQGEPIERDGKPIHPIYRREVKGSVRFRVRWVSGVDSPLQGVSISVKAGILKVADTKAKDLVLWQDSAPREVTVECSGKGVRELFIWNCWRDDRGVTQAWLGNAGMQLTEHAASVIRVTCNSRSVVTFEDLVFDLIFGES